MHVNFGSLLGKHESLDQVHYNLGSIKEYIIPNVSHIIIQFQTKSRNPLLQILAVPAV